MMIKTLIGAAAIAVAAVALSTTFANAQGQTQKQIVISKPMMKSMVAHKPKSKAQLGTKAGIIKRNGALAAKSQNQAPTSVRESRKRISSR